MDLSHPLSSLAPSLDAEALTVLERTEQPLTGRNVASLARRGSQPAIQNVLDRLVDHGLVLVQPAGPSRLYRLNRDHLLAPAVLAAVAARDTLLNRLRESIGGWVVPCVHASLFGSVARGEAGPASDVDVLVVRADDVDEDDSTWSRQLTELENAVLAWTGNSLSWFETTPQSLAAAIAGEEEPVVESWRRDAVALSGISTATLLRDAAAAAR